MLHGLDSLHSSECDLLIDRLGSPGQFYTSANNKAEDESTYASGRNQHDRLGDQLDLLVTFCVMEVSDELSDDGKGRGYDAYI